MSPLKSAFSGVLHYIFPSSQKTTDLKKFSVEYYMNKLARAANDSRGCPLTSLLRYPWPLDDNLWPRHGTGPRIELGTYGFSDKCSITQLTVIQIRWTLILRDR